MFLPKTPKILILFSNGKYCNFRFSIFDFHFWIFEFITVPLSFHSTPQVPPPVILIIVPTPFLFLFYSPDPSNSSPRSQPTISLTRQSRRIISIRSFDTRSVSPILRPGISALWRSDGKLTDIRHPILHFTSESKFLHDPHLSCEHSIAS